MPSVPPQSPDRHASAGQVSEDRLEQAGSVHRCRPVLWCQTLCTVAAKHDAATFSGLQRINGSLRDHLGFMFGDRSENVQRQSSRSRIITGDKLGLAVHHRAEESDIAGKAIKLGNDELGLEPLAGGQGLRQFGPGVSFARLDFGKLGGHRAANAGQVLPDRFLLRFKSKAGSTLPGRADSEICDKSGRLGLHGLGSVTGRRWFICGNYDLKLQYYSAIILQGRKTMRP